MREQEASKRVGYKALYMDIWAEEELRKARDALCLNISDTELSERIHRYIADFYHTLWLNIYAVG